jgi:hypothetical protein
MVAALPGQEHLDVVVVEVGKDEKVGRFASRQKCGAQMQRRTDRSVGLPLRSDEQMSLIEATLTRPNASGGTYASSIKERSSRRQCSKHLFPADHDGEIRVRNYELAREAAGSRLARLERLQELYGLVVGAGPVWVVHVASPYTLLIALPGPGAADD